MGDVPVAARVNIAVCPVVIALPVGCVAIAGAMAAALTVSVAALLVTLPVELLITTVNCDPLSDVAAAGLVYAGEIAPLMVVPFFRH